jgi:crotonobetainyl-CoA:carnitine CoA-transferase CaiB-like acyl-CoA transferase
MRAAIDDDFHVDRIRAVSGPLDGITVVDFTRVLSGPYCTMILSDLGARVIKIEHPVRGDDTRHWGPPFIGQESAYFLSINRNKESLTLDFKHPEGKRVLDALLPRADVVVENFRPGTLEAARLDGPTLLERHPRLVYCSISGYGHTGPRREEAGYDAVIQAEGGLMSVTGDADGPSYRLGVAISDIVAGMFAAHGVVAALFAREKSGVGQIVDIGMLDATAALLTYQAGNYFTTGETPRRLGNRHPTIVPYEVFDTSDGEIVIAVGNDPIWLRFCEAAELPELGADERFATNRGRVSHYAELRPVLDRAFKARTRQDWLRALREAGIPCGSVRDVAEVLKDPQLKERAMIAELHHPTVGPINVMGSAIKLSATPPAIRTPPPTLGQHREAILSELGYDRQSILALETAGVI